MLDNKESLMKKTEKVGNKNGLESSSFFGWKIRRKYIGDVRNYTSYNLKQSVGEWENRLLTRDEEKELFDRYRKTWDKVVFDKIVVSNLWFVVYLAECIYKDLKSQCSCRDVYLDDLIQSWSIWLIKAAQKYVPERKKRFLFYAQHDIKRSILHYINYENSFFWPELDWWVGKCKVKETNEYIENFIHENQREPENFELESFYYEKYNENFDNYYKADYYKYMHEGNLSLDKSVKELSKEKGVENIKVEWYMWDFINSENIEDDIYLRDLLVNKEPGERPPLEIESLRHDLNEVMMRRLSPRDKEILNMYYGLNWYNEHEIEEIAAHYWSRLECVRTSKEKAVRKLRNSYAADKLLRDYMW